MVVILVPQGAEYQAVVRGVHGCGIQVLPIPIGVMAVRRFLEQTSELDHATHVLIMGLCGSLSPHYQVGDVALYADCTDANGATLTCDRALTQRLETVLQTSPVRGYISDRVITASAKKRSLSTQFQAQVVDMEGMALQNCSAAIAMVRVVSDDVHHELPDLSNAIDESGTLRILPLAIGMIRQPIGAVRLIRGSLKGLRSLEKVARSVGEGFAASG